MKRSSRNGWARPWPLLVLLLSACASSPPERRADNAPAAADTNDVDRTAATALALWGTDATTYGSQALAQIQQATKAAPERPDLLWLHLRLCVETPGCEPQSIENRLRKLDASNGAVWLGPLARAQQRGDTRAEEQILEVMTQAEKFDVYWTTLVARLTPPLSATPVATAVAQPIPTPLTNAMNSTVSWLSSLATPAFAAVSTACDEQHIRDPGTRVRCEQISQALQKSDTTLAEGIGLGIAQRLALPNSATAMQVTDRVQTLRHQNQASGAVIAAQVEKEKFSQQMLKLMAQLDKEQEVARAILRWAGQPLTP